MFLYRSSICFTQMGTLYEPSYTFIYCMNLHVYELYELLYIHLLNFIPEFTSHLFSKGNIVLFCHMLNKHFGGRPTVCAENAWDG